MPNFTGYLMGKSTMQSIVCLNDIPEHELMLRSGSAENNSSDEHFNHAKHTSWSTVDLILGHGQESGYFMNERSNGDCDCGNYECEVSTVNGQISMEGTWKYTHGTGQFSGITGGGTFKGRMISPTETDISYEGNYQLKAGIRAA